MRGDPSVRPDFPIRSAEFFAGIGLVHYALVQEGIEVVWANDIEPVKARMYSANFPQGHYALDDVRNVKGAQLPTVDLATASFPCTDLSLAGWRRGLAGEQSSMFWEFARVIEEMKSRRPNVVMLENVPAFATSHGGSDLKQAIFKMNKLGYSCDLFVVDARHFVPQSRQRLFVVGSTVQMGPRPKSPDELRPEWVVRFAKENPRLTLHAFPLSLPPADKRTLSNVVECDKSSSLDWWPRDRVKRFLSSLSQVQRTRLRQLEKAQSRTWRTAYRRTRGGIAVWEIRPDAIAGCLRTARGGSSKQAVVEVGQNETRVRWMTPREYARLQGVRDDFSFADLTANKIMFGFGDAVCVPVIRWIAEAYLRPVIELG
jgi:DNA (cytosine-5)-methyltransferase 1